MGTTGQLLEATEMAGRLAGKVCVITGTGGGMGRVALEGAAASGADVELIWVRDLGLPLYTDEHAPPPGAHRLAGTSGW
jgi:NAD(P)-dependent dehydrogenase (short-subunit alcohol dehydrogenase family)